MDLAHSTIFNSVIMKNILFIVAFILTGTAVKAQPGPLQLPKYKAGQYENTTIYKHDGTLGASGNGFVKLSPKLAAKFLSGVQFKVVIDSINKGTSAVHTAFKDSLGHLVKMHAGDTLAVPATFRIDAGKIGLHIIVEGTPLIAGESYLCELNLGLTLGTDWDVYIYERSTVTCLVDPVNGLDPHTVVPTISAYPNPFNAFTTIDYKNPGGTACELLLFDAQGTRVMAKYSTEREKIHIEKDQLSKGMYIFQIRNKSGINAQGKLMVN